MSYFGVAMSRWRDAEWISGDGPWASVSWCNVLTVMLFNTSEEAEAAKNNIDSNQCGHLCFGAKAHEVVFIG